MYMILNGMAEPTASAPAHYRGCYRSGPTYCTEVPASHEINRLFAWYLDEGGERGVVSNVSKAMRYAHLLNAMAANGSPFEVIAVSPEGRGRAQGGLFLGYDVAAGFNYSLVWAVVVCSGGSTRSGTDQRSDEARALVEAFSGELNRYGLFETAQTAGRFLHEIKVIQERFPEAYESGDLREFEVVGIELVS